MGRFLALSVITIILVISNIRYNFSDSELNSMRTQFESGNFEGAECVTNTTEKNKDLYSTCTGGLFQKRDEYLRSNHVFVIFSPRWKVSYFHDNWPEPSYSSRSLYFKYWFS